MVEDLETPIPESETLSNQPEQAPPPTTPEADPLAETAAEVEKGFLQAVLNKLDGNLKTAQAIVDKVTDALSAKDIKVTRRDFLRLTAAAAGTLGAGALLKASTPEQTQPIETEQKSNTKTLVIDLSKDTFADTASIGIPLIPEEELASSLGIEPPLDINELQEHVPDSYATRQQVAVHLLRLYYQNHLDNVLATMEKVSTALGITFQSPRTESLTSESLHSIDKQETEIGDWLLKFRIDPEKMGELIGEETFVSLSLQTRGAIELDMFHVEEKVTPGAINPQDVKIVTKKFVGSDTEETTYTLPDGTQTTAEEFIKISKAYSTPTIKPNKQIDIHPLDAYADQDLVFQALLDMANLARQFPDKIFFIAAGNPNKKGYPDIGKTIAQLKQNGLWTNNIFTIGYVGTETISKEWRGETGEELKIAPYTYSGMGADYYVDTEVFSNLDVPYATSFATPIAKQLVSEYFSVNDMAPTPENVREFLDSHSRSIEDYKVINFDQIKQEIAVVQTDNSP